MLCNYRCSNDSLCYYEREVGKKLCYFHVKVEAGLIDGYYENLTQESRDSRWVVLS